MNNRIDFAAGENLQSATKAMEDNTSKKQWIKPESKVLNISNSGTGEIDVSSARRDAS